MPFGYLVVKMARFLSRFSRPIGVHADREANVPPVLGEKVIQQADTGIADRKRSKRATGQWRVRSREFIATSLSD